MNTLVLNGTSYAAGLYWLARKGPGATSRAARRLGRPWCVHRGAWTGFAAGDIGIDPEGAGAGASPEGRPALALALLDHITVDFWMALVEGEPDTGQAGDSDPGDGDSIVSGEARFALVKARAGVILADGDEIFESRAAALDAFARARPLGWALFATPGLIGGGAFDDLDTGAADIAELDTVALAAKAAEAGAAIGLERVPPPSLDRRAGRPCSAWAGCSGRRIRYVVLPRRGADMVRRTRARGNGGAGCRAAGFRRDR